MFVAALLLCTAATATQAASDDRVTAKAVLNIAKQLVEAIDDLNQLRHGKEGTDEFGYVEELITIGAEASDWSGFVGELLFLKSVMRDRADAEAVNGSLRNYVTQLNQQSDLWIRQVNESLRVIKSPAAISRGEYIRERIRELQRITASRSSH